MVEDVKEHRLLALVFDFPPQDMKSVEEQQSQTAQVFAASPLFPPQPFSFVIDFRSVILKSEVYVAALQRLQQLRSLLILFETFLMAEEEEEGILTTNEYQDCFQLYRVQLYHHLLFFQR
jgi:hypothetical protein